MSINKKAAPVQDWDEIESLRESLREHMAEIHRLRAALADHSGDATEMVYQISLKNGAASSAWIDVDEAAYNSAKLYGEYKCRILYTGEKNG